MGAPWLGLRAVMHARCQRSVGEHGRTRGPLGRPESARTAAHGHVAAGASLRQNFLFGRFWAILDDFADRIQVSAEPENSPSNEASCSIFNITSTA